MKTHTYTHTNGTMKGTKVAYVQCKVSCIQQELCPNPVDIVSWSVAATLCAGPLRSSRHWRGVGLYKGQSTGSVTFHIGHGDERVSTPKLGLRGCRTPLGDRCSGVSLLTAADRCAAAWVAELPQRAQQIPRRQVSTGQRLDKAA